MSDSPPLRARLIVLPTVRALVRVLPMDMGYAGGTIRIVVEGLERLDDDGAYQPVTAEDDVAMTVTFVAPDGTEWGTSEVVASDNDWSLDTIRPDDPGRYGVRVEAIVDGTAVGRWTAEFRVRAW